jgi:hypothetical protein
VPRAKRAKSKPSRGEARQLDLLDRATRKLTRPAVAIDRGLDDCVAPPKKLRHRLWNALVGVSLLPFVWILTDALFDTFAGTRSRHPHLPFWMSYEFQMFAIGAGAWLVWLCISLLIWKRPRPVHAYVVGHELMHMLMARLSRGRIKDYLFSSEGGYIVTNKYNFLIALAPYLWPFYSVPVLAAWSVSLYWEQAWHYREWFLAALGFTWMFHLTFTLWILPRGQSDFHGPGRIFSLALIYLANTALLTGALIILAPEVTWRGYSRELWASTVAFYQWAGHALAQLTAFTAHLLAPHSG